MKDEIRIEVKITGPSGCGKTIFLNELAHKLERDGYFPIIKDGGRTHTLVATKELRDGQDITRAGFNNAPKWKT